MQRAASAVTVQRRAVRFDIVGPFFFWTPPPYARAKERVKTQAAERAASLRNLLEDHAGMAAPSIVSIRFRANRAMTRRALITGLPRRRPRNSSSVSKGGIQC